MTWLLLWVFMEFVAAVRPNRDWFVQRISGKRAAVVTSGMQACNKEAFDRFGKMCKDRKPTYKRNLATQTSAETAGFRQPWLGDGGKLVELMKQAPEHQRWSIPQAAWSAFERLRFHDARQLLAFKESWTDEDTELLGALDSTSNGFTVGEFTHEAIKAQLPSVSLLDNLTSRSSLAVVGAGASLAKHGKEIDAHDVVVRFNSHVGETLVPDDTGVRMDVHVVNKNVALKDREDVLVMDLESSFPHETYCSRWRPPKPHDLSVSFSNVTLASRPAAFCGLQDLSHFTRGFLFFWLVGRHFNKVDTYGMSESDGVSHYGEGGRVVEPFLPFEHLLYTMARKLQAEQTPSAILQVSGSEEGAESGFRLEMHPWPENPFEDAEVEQEETKDGEEHEAMALQKEATQVPGGNPSLSA